MKNKLIILTCIIFFIGIFFVFDIEGFEDLNNSISIKNVNIINNKEFENIKNNRSESEYDLLDIKYRNNEVPYDSNKNIYYISKYNNGYDFDVFYSNNTNVKSIKVNDKNFIEVIAYNKNKYKVYNICLSEFPIVNINLNNKKNSGSELISKNYTYGNVNIFDNKQYKNKLNVISESAKFKTRGLSSMSYKKKSYSIQFIYSNSGENKLVNNLLGLKKNNRYALNSLYEDNSKIRDILSLNLWKNIDKDNANDVDMKYVELFINNEYYGFGLGAAGYIGNIRYTNTRNLSKYISGNYERQNELLTKEDKIKYEFILGLRLTKGINKDNFNRKYDININEIEVIKELINKGLLIDDEINIYVPKKYFYVLNDILVNFV